MQKRIGMALAVAGLAVVPALAQAQARSGMAMGGSPHHEFGVDIVAGLQSFGSGGGSGLFVGTPVDVRVGFVSASNMSWEGRLNLSLATVGTTRYSFDPGANLLFKMGRGTLQNNKYFTVGADLNIEQLGPGASGVVPAINGGIGMRRPYGTGSWRFEAFVRYLFKNTTVAPASEFQIGVRAGLSLWH
jgi:hypothetical protein